MSAHKADLSRINRRAFVDYIIRRCNGNKGDAAALRRADNSIPDFKAWEILAGFGVQLDDEYELLPVSTTAAAIARAEAKSNGGVLIGRALAIAYEKDGGNTSDQAKAKLRRLLACDGVPEACRILRPLFSLIEAKGNSALDYASLLNDLLRFGYDDNQNGIKARWAQSFYGKPTEGGKDE